jgi:futalosine hydrolase
LKILLVFATSAEADILNNIRGLQKADGCFRMGSLELTVLITGVGGISTAWAMKQYLCSNPPPQLAINAGIAGSYNDEYRVGDVVMPVSDCFADMGIESEDKYLTLAEAGLMNPEKFPFKNGCIIADNNYTGSLNSVIRTVKAITVNTATGTQATIDKLKRKYYPDIETMEGATFFYICAIEKIPFLAIRGISNKVEPRNKKGWDIPLALDNLAGKLNELLLMVG